MATVGGSSPSPATKTKSMAKKILTLSVKQVWFDKIMSGEKTEEYRVGFPPALDKYFHYVDEAGKAYKFKEIAAIEDEHDLQPEPVEYDAIKFLTGAYTGKRPWAIVECKGVELEKALDKDGEEIYFQEGLYEFPVLQMTYKLGKVLEKSDY